ncbi:MAG: hypothetical protein RJA76_25 [Bacteroidota bacterium]|jgi:lipopolysaccharide transport system permease protein
MINLNTYFKEIFEHLNLIFILAKRDLKVRYSQTLLGVFWAIVKPLSTLFIFIFMFKKIANINQINGVPIQIIILSGIIFWNFFGSSFTNVSNCISANTNLITKVYFPRLILAISTISVAIVDFIFSFIIYIVASFILNVPIGISIIGIPLLLLFISLFSIGAGLLFAANSIKYRDIQHIGPLVVQYGFFITPVIYSIQSINFGNYLAIYYIINPLVGLIELGRFLLINDYSINLTYIGYSILSTLIVFMIGVLVFIKKENSFVDHL